MMLDLAPVFQAVRQAAALCRLVQEKYIIGDVLQSAQKSGAEPVTIADYGSQAIICRSISLTFPEDAVIAEEGGQQFQELITDVQQQEIAELISQVLGESIDRDTVTHWLDYGRDRQASRTWVIDPIDGTKGFIALRNYAIAVGILEDGVPVAGLMGTPGYAGMAGGALFYAQDKQACIQPLSGGVSRLIKASNRTKPESLIVVESVEKSHTSHDTTGEVLQGAGISGARIQRLDSQEKYCLVACGDADAYMRFPPRGGAYGHKIWDHAAGVAIAQAAGSLATDIDGSTLDFSLGKILEKNRGMIVANPYIHERLVQAVSQMEL